MSSLRPRVLTAGRVAVVVLLALAALPVVLLSGGRTAEAGPPPVFTIFVPFEEESIDQALWSILTTVGSSGNQITSQITVTIAADDTILYWDHWEDGYEADIANAAPSSTTETWGDQDVSNGAAPGVTLDADDVLDGGDVVTLQNDVPLPRNPASILFDGRDKVAATRGIVLTRAGWDTALGTVHAGAVAASNLSQFGTQFDIPVGENIASNQAFEYTSVSVQASDDDTFVELDIDGDGDVDQSATIGEGETWFVDGGVNAGARVETSKPAQVHLITGDVGSTVSGRWYEVFPQEILDSEYVAAAQTTNAGNPVSVFVHNTNDAPITVAVDAVGTLNDTNLNIPQRGTISYTLPDGSGARFSSSDGNFSAVSATVALAGNTTAYDWGYTLVPASSLTSGVIVGWGDGSQVAGRNDSPVWIAPLDATDLEVDFDNDGIIDQTITGVQQYESVKIVDTTDFDMTGARILSPTGVRLSAAWGQDPDVADTVTAYDLGTAVLPSTSLIVTKTAELATDQNADGRVNPGDSLRYEITAADAGSLPLNDVIAVDDLPSTLTYVPGTATVGGVPIADDTIGTTVFPFDETGYNLGTLNPGGEVIATFEAALVDPFPLFTTTVRNTVVLTTAEGDTTQATSIVPVVIPDLYLAKTNDLTAPALPGQTFTYSMAVGNIDTSAQTGIAVSDPLPPEVNWVSTSVTRPVDDTGPGATKQASDSFTTVSYSNDAADWDGDWIETESGGAGPSAGDVTITSDLGSNRLQLAGDAVAVQRTVDTSGFGRVEVSFDWRRVGFEADDLVRFEVSNTGGTTFIEVDRFEGTADDPAFTLGTYDLTNFGGGDLTLRWTTSAGFDGADEEFQLDDVSVDLTRRIDETVAGVAPPALYSAGELLAGESLTVDVTVTVDPSIGASIDEFVNTASASSTQSPSALQSSSTVQVARASVGDTVWHDQDGDGVVDGAEPRLAGVTVELRDSTNAVVATDVTDASGQYLFADLDPGDYTVTVIAGVPAGMAPTDDADGGQDETTAVTLGFGTVNDTTDFGYATPVTIGDRVFADIDGDGVENGVDFGIDGLDVTITGTSSNSSHQGGSTTTTSAGSYSFSNLLPGTYTITVDTAPLSTASYATTTANSQSGDTQTITVTSGNDDLTGDFGYVLPAAIGDLVWHDLDADGVRDGGEPAMAGVTVTATGPGLPVGGVSRTTDANGYYLFANLDAGTFTITVTPGTGDLPADYDSSTGGDSQSSTVATDGLDDTVDFGFYTQGSIGDLVFEDVNGNGVYDSGLDAPLDGIDVTITGTTPGASHPGGSTQSTVAGAYDFTDLEPGTYTVTVDTSGFPAGTVNTLNGASPSVTIRSTDDVDTADFGYLFPASIGDFVWHDLDGDGLYDSGTEAGLAGVVLTLTGGALGPGGVSTTTDASGAYAFSNLPPGTYSVEVTGLPVGYSLSTTNPLAFTVDSADVVDTADFGAFTTADIGDLVWHDLNADGTYDLGEPVFDAVTVTISGGGLATPITVDTGSGAFAGGEYLFPDLDPGTYTVTVDVGDLPAGYASTTGGDARSVVLESAADQLDIDFGYATTATVGDLVYDDLNGDGDRDLGEPGIDGVTVTLSQGATTVATIDTSGGGAYDFTGVAPGTYEVTIDTGDLPAGAVVLEGAGGYTSLVVVSADDIDTVDFGSYVPASLGDRLWVDTNGDGIQDAGETDGFAGVTVTLTGPGLPSGGVTDVTDAAGTYGFAGLEPGAYTVTITTTDLPAGAVNTFGGSSQVTTLTSGENDLSIDFGWYVPASIGDLVWHDLNGDGTRDLGEPGIDAVTVTLDDGVATVTQDTVNGAYDFTGLAPDSYDVSIDTADLDAGAVSTTGGFAQNSIAVVSGDDIDTVDFGVRYPASIGDLVFEDVDGNGSFDIGEPGIGGITVTITGTSSGASHPGGTTTVTATTGAVGSYDFGNLLPGTYDVVVDTGDVDLPTGATASTVTTHTISVASQDDDDSADFGFFRPASVGDRVFDDANGDGDDETGGDPGLAGVTLELRQGATTITSFTTTASGAYDFAGLAPGTYDVVVTNVPAGYSNTLGGTSQTVTLGSGDDENGIDFGYQLGASIGDLVFEDLNGDGVWQVTEPGYDGVTVTLSGDASATQDTVNGAYDFTGLTPGTYTVTVDTADLPAGVVNTLGGVSQTFTIVSGDDEDGGDFGWYLPASIGDLVWTDTNGSGTHNPAEAGIAGVDVTVTGTSPGASFPTGTVVTTGALGDYGVGGLAPGTYSVELTAGIPADHVSTTGGNSQTVTVGSGDSDLTVDFGLADFVDVGDRVWHDLDGDGVQDAAETDGIAGVDLELVDLGNIVVGTATTDAAGSYAFTDVRPGQYTVRVVTATVPAGYAATSPESIAVTATSGIDILTADVGYRTTGSIGDLVWEDLDGDGVFDPGTESGVPGVTVTLGGDDTGTVVTDGSGAYSFDDLDPGSYTVTISVPAAATVTTTGGATQSTTLMSAEVDDTLDFGLAFPASIGDLIWHDVDADGTFDVGTESGIAGVVVELRDGGGTVIATDTTDGTGTYSFTGLLPGDRQITVDATTLPIGAVSGTRYAPTTTDTYAITLESGDVVTTADVGYATTAAIEGTIFEDDDASGALDLGESGLAGVDVELVDGATVVATVTTATDGTYAFTGVAPGSYTVRVDAATVPAGYGPTSPTSVLVTPESDERITDVDVGYTRPATIGDLVWHDLDGDGVHDAGTEPGLAGVDVELVDGTNTVIATETTAADGSFDFAAVGPGSYTVRVDLATLPSGTNSGAVFLSSAGLPTSLPFTVVSGDDIDSADFAFRTTASIGDSVWHDLDADGAEDAGEPGLVGVTVELLDATNVVVATTATDAVGGYSFDALAPGTYTVRLDRTTLPAGYSSTTGNDPTTLTVVSDQRRDDVDFGEALLTGGLVGDQIWDDLDGDGVQDAGEPGLDGVTVELLQGATVVATRVTMGGGGYTFANLAPGSYSVRVDASTVPAGYVSSTGGLAQSTTLLSGQIDRDRDFGFVAPATIGDRVWHDLDADGLQDAGEPGLAGVTVEIRDGATVVATATTDGAGAYSVDVAPGTYDVVLDAATVPDGVNSGAPMTLTAAPAGSLVVVSNDSIDIADFGLVTTARIGDTIFDDLNGDGDQDPGEPGLVGVDVLLDDGVGGITRVTSGVDGFYEFTGVDPGSYTVDAATLPTGAVATTTGSPVPVTVESDELVDDIDLGFARPASLAGVVWTDSDGSGTRTGEPLLAGIVVELLDDTDTVVGTQTTGAGGDYLFDALAPGDYTVRPTLPSGAALTSPNVGTDDLVDSDVLPATGRTAPISVRSGDVITGVDAGVFEPGSVGDTVFADLNRNGVQDPGEPGIDGVTITVRDGGGVVVGSDVTSGGGVYRVDVDPGMYSITMTVPAGWGVAPGDDVTSATITSGADVDDADFPLLGARSLDGSVIYDVAGDASLDASDPGLGGITMTATWNGPTGPVDVTTTTAADGTFVFDDLPPGTYSVAVDDTDLPDGIIDPTVDPDGPAGGIDLLTDVDLSTADVSAVDFGVTGTARLGDNVFIDRDGDGDLDSGEPGVGGVTVTAVVTTSAGVMTYRTVTDPTGFYEFTDLPAGDYTVSVDPTTIPIGLAAGGGDRSTSLVIGGADDSVDMPLVEIVGPTAIPDTDSTPPTTPVDIPVLGNDRPQPGTAVSVVSHTEPSNGSLVLLPGDVFRYTPNADFAGRDTFVYTICDLDALARHGDTAEMRAVLCSTTTVSIDTPPPAVAEESSPTPGGSGTTGTTGSGDTPTSTSSDPDLPRTGSNALSLPLYGAFLVGLGLALWLITRRRDDLEPAPARIPVAPWPEPDPSTRRD